MVAQIIYHSIIIYINISVASLLPKDATGFNKGEISSANFLLKQIVYLTNAQFYDEASKYGDT